MKLDSRVPRRRIPENSTLVAGAREIQTTIVQPKMSCGRYSESKTLIYRENYYCEVEKNESDCFLDIFISYKSYFKIFMVDVNKGHKFFLQNLTVEISTPVEYSMKN